MSREDVLRDVAGAAERQDELVRVALTTGDELDDIRRAKIWTRIEDRLDDRVPSPWRWLLAGGAGALALAAIVMVFVTRGHGASEGFVAPADATLSLRLGHTRAALVGPARLDVVEQSDATTTVALRSGRFLGDFEGGHGRSLRIEAPGATIEIVGTLFAVDVHGGGTCVSVAHGRVRMTTFTRVLAISGGETACSDAPEPRAIASEVGEALAHHAATLALADHPRPTVSSLPPPVAPPVRGPGPGPGPGPRPGPGPGPGPASSSASASASWSASRVASAPASGSASISAPAPASESESESGSGSGSAPAPAPAPAPASASAPAPASVSITTPVSPRPEPTPPLPTPPVAKPPTADDLYRTAEAALARHDVAAADRALAQIADTSSLLDQALYERARIAYDRRAWDDARHHLARLATIATSPLLEPGAYLSCRIAIAANDSTADACLTSYRATYPHSPHDLDVLGLLVDRAYRAGGCTRAAPLVDELARLYQATTLARGWRTRCP